MKEKERDRINEREGYLQSPGVEYELHPRLVTVQ